MKIINLKKNILNISCTICGTDKAIFKFSKTKIFCDGCTATLAVPLANKTKILHKSN